MTTYPLMYWGLGLSERGDADVGVRSSTIASRVDAMQ